MALYKAVLLFLLLLFLFLLFYHYFLFYLLLLLLLLLLFLLIDAVFDPMTRFASNLVDSSSQNGTLTASWTNKGNFSISYK